jgi:NADPH2:quinone reductase
MTVPATMQACFIRKPGGPEVLAVQEVTTPRPAPGEVLVKVHASALNRADLLQRQGRYPAPPGASAEIPGLEFAGEVVALGAGTERSLLGQRVFGLVSGGAHAEYLTVHAAALAEIPPTLTWEEAAAVPEAFITAHDALRQGRCRPDEYVLVHAAGSGVGLAAIQLAQHLGAHTLGTSRSPDKLERASKLGLEHGFVLSSAANLERWARQVSGGRGADLALDLVGGPILAATIKCMATFGRVIMIGTVAGARSEIELGPILSRRLHIIGTVLRSRSLAEKIAVTRLFALEVVPLLEQRLIRPVIDSVYTLADIALAHQRLESNATFGKVVVAIRS